MRCEPARNPFPPFVESLPRGRISLRLEIHEECQIFHEKKAKEGAVAHKRLALMDFPLNKCPKF